MSWSIDIQITKEAWLSQPRQRWNAGLERAGMNFRTGLSRAHYPPLPPSGDVRTYQTADKAGFRITEPGRVMEFGSTFYLPFILFGTRHRVRPRRMGTSYLSFTRTEKMVEWAGWPGKRDELVDLMRRGFISGIQDYSE